MARKSQANKLADSLKSVEWLGAVVTWSSGRDGTSHKHADVVAALVEANLNPDVAKEFLPRHAFSRAMRQLKDQRIIDVFRENESEVIFQFTRKEETADELKFTRETFVTLNKVTGAILSDVPEVSKQASAALAEAMESRQTADITRIVQKLFDDHADLIPLRDAGGVYFVPQEYVDFTKQVGKFLEKLGGRIDVIPMPKGTPDGDKAIQNAVAGSIEGLIADHLEAVESFEKSTRKDTIDRQAERIRDTRVRIEAYAHYLGTRQRELISQAAKATKRLKAKMEEIGGGATAYTTYDWDAILDGKVHKLEQGEDFLGKAVSCLTRARKHASDRGLKVRTKVLEDGKYIVLQAVPGDTAKSDRGDVKEVVAAE